jgi:NAD(P)-dependent dehydrogenase (short-subunit alcohol dehydrogenase family)
MRDQGWGRIVNVSSMGANFVFPGGGIYHATKYAVDAISDALRFEVQGFGVGVAIIQPGLIHTEFGNTAAKELSVEEGPYGTFNAAVGEATKGVYENGLLGKFGGGPETVAKAIEKAVTAKKPKTRYRVTPSAHMLINQRKLMTDGMWDKMVSTQFPRPGKS